MSISRIMPVRFNRRGYQLLRYSSDLGAGLYWPYDRRLPRAARDDPAPARHRGLGDSDGDLDRHQRPDYYDRRGRRRTDPARRAGEPARGYGKNGMTEAVMPCTRQWFLTVLLPFISWLSPGMEASAGPLDITVMTQNLYLGAEPDAILAASTPAELQAAIQAASDSFTANNYPLRATAIASDAVKAD